jgi:hypothetical protein
MWHFKQSLEAAKLRYFPPTGLPLGFEGFLYFLKLVGSSPFRLGAPLFQQPTQAMKSISETTLRKTASFKNTLLVSLLWMAMALFVMPEAMRQNSIYANGAERIGGLPHQSPSLFYQNISRFGENGRQHLIAIELTADVFFAIVTSLLLCSLMLWSLYFSKNKNLKAGHSIRLALLILFAALMENASMVVILLAYPTTNRGLYYLTAIFSIIKIVAIAVSLGVSIWNLSIYFIHRPETEPAIEPGKAIAENSNAGA